MNDLAAYLAAEARRLGLDRGGLDDAHTDAVRAFAQAVLNELAALGLIRGGEEAVGYWPGSRVGGH